ncbi:MAG: triose-phosphate isomerase [Chitinophagia bacterium]|jgi:triosephosphate isomerase|nr:triose-phosphate isomerase [Chitinophagia bacterium]NCA30416.1 triose-phosphate isomerase [Chitinophagia bacterium]
MRKQIAAANWKMNLSLAQAETLLNELIASSHSLGTHQEAIFAVPSIYIPLALAKLANKHNVFVAAQNCHQKESGAFTGEISASMLASIGVKHIIVGHSERREYFAESDSLLAEKVNAILAIHSTPIFCCGEPLAIREASTQNAFVETQLKNSLFHLSAEDIVKVVIAYEPIWAIGTGKTATSAQAQDIHAYIRSCFASKYGQAVANEITILYGGSVKASNAKELFSQTDVDGGLVGGASLVATEFTAIINALS